MAAARDVQYLRLSRAFVIDDLVHQSIGMQGSNSTASILRGLLLVVTLDEEEVRHVMMDVM